MIDYLVLRTKRRAQDGQAIVLFALALFVVMGMGAVAVDGGYGLVQQRRAQNAADFAAQAGTLSLAGLCAGQGNAPRAGAVYDEVQFVIDRNASDVGSGWTAYYLDSAGNYFAGTPPVSAPGATKATATKVLPQDYPPSSACGIQVDLVPRWNTFVSNVLGTSSASTVAGSRALAQPSAGGGVGIVALDEVNPHQILGGGAGNFDVFGTIFANSAVPYDPWGSPHQWCGDSSNVSPPNCPNLQYVDTVDAKGGSKLILHGDMQTVTSNVPLDWCFDGTSGPPNTPPTYTQGVRDSGQRDPKNKAVCSVGNVDLEYDHIVRNNPQKPDPLRPATGNPGLRDPFVAGVNDGLCPGESSAPARTAPAPVGGVISLLPGIYASPVIAYGAVDVKFLDCGTSGYAGVFRFAGGLDLRPDSGHTVTGTNVMIATLNPVPEPGNVPGSVTSAGVFNATTISGTTTMVGGNGAPCWPTGIVNENNGAETDGGSPLCGGTVSSSGQVPSCAGATCPPQPNGPWYGVRTYKMGTNGSGCCPQDSNTYGTGTNFSLILGGQGTVDVSGPTTGYYHGVVAFQGRDVRGNFGMDAEMNDSASVKLTGVVYNGSDPCLGFPYRPGTTTCTTPTDYQSYVPSNPNNFWDTGTPFKPGGVMQAGMGMGFVGSNTGAAFPNRSTGSVQVLGPCVVADFNTDGATTISIDGGPNSIFPLYTLPGIAPSGNPRIAG